MNEEVVLPIEGEVPVVEEQIETPKEPTEVEQRALEMGWRPKEEFDGEEVDFIDAQEFVRRKPLFDKIDSIRREQKETQKALRALQDHHARVKEVEYQRALNSLRAAKKTALEEGDADKLIAIDEQIADTKAARQVAEQPVQISNERHPNFVNWTDRNKWYETDPELHKEADRIGLTYANENPDVHPDEVLEYVSKRIKKFFPEKFTNPNKARPSAVEGSSTKPVSRQTSGDDVTLTEDERRAMNTFIRQGILTKEQYLADIKNLRGHA